MANDKLMLKKTLKTAIVDDEVHARNVLIDYVSKIDRLQLVHTSANALDLLQFMQTTSPDLIFLDINMPELSGLEFLQSLTHTPHVILTTAYSEFALESYEYGVVDYLLKPIKFSRFLKAINKTLGQELDVTESAPTDKGSSACIEIKHDGIFIQVALDTIDYLKSFGNYIKIITPKRTYIIMETMTSMEQRLPGIFQRVHKSYIVNTQKVKKINTTHVIIAETEIPLSPMYRLLLQEKLKR